MAKQMGRPLAFKTVEKLDEKIKSYFEMIEEKGKVPTVTGLAYYLDITRETLVQYRKKENFSDSISRAKQRIEVFWEENLLTPKVTAGVKFNLSNNYDGWSDKQEIDQTLKINGQLDSQLMQGRQKVAEKLAQRKTNAEK